MEQGPWAAEPITPTPVAELHPPITDQHLGLHRFLPAIGQCNLLPVTKAKGDGPTLAFTKAQFTAWLDGAKDGQFDHMAG